MLRKIIGILIFILVIYGTFLIHPLLGSIVVLTILLLILSFGHIKKYVKESNMTEDEKIKRKIFDEVLDKRSRRMAEEREEKAVSNLQ
ncbi:MAG: hypothetical protein JWN37_667 [Candidatus Nomurabacteria bacterium]|nr:hypothetical protein [Candidatus Nomurabacteria bacterium]